MIWKLKTSSSGCDLVIRIRVMQRKDSVYLLVDTSMSFCDDVGVQRVNRDMSKMQYEVVGKSRIMNGR